MTGYEVSRIWPESGEEGLVHADVFTTGGAATAWVDDSIPQAGVTYTYRVRADRSGETSEWSNEAQVEVPDSGDVTAEPADPSNALPQTASVTFVTNLSEDDRGETRIEDDRRLANAFTTGPATYGFAIDGVSLMLRRDLLTPTNAALAVSIHTDNSGSPGSSLITFTQESGTVGYK